MMQSIWKEADMTSWTSSWEEGFWGSYVGPVLVSLPSIIYSIGVFFANLYYRQLINRLTEWGISLPPPSFRLVTFHVPPAPGSIPQSFIRQSDATVSTDDGSGDVDWRRSAIDSHLIHIWVGKTNSNSFFFLFSFFRLENHRTESQFERNRVTKLILFEFVNNFMSLFYIAFYLQDIDMLRWVTLTSVAPTDTYSDNSGWDCGNWSVGLAKLDVDSFASLLSFFVTVAAAMAAATANSDNVIRQPVD